MNIAILGAGIIGVTTAYELAADGHAVTVFERHTSIGEEASFANAGILSTGCVAPWTAPGMAGKLGRHILTSNAPLRMARPLHAADLGWMRRWLTACRSGNFAANQSRLLRLAIYSQQRMREVSASMAYTFDRSDGHMVLLRSEKDRRQIQPALIALRELAVPFHEISPSEARQLEPALHPHTDLAGAVYFPQDEVANCRQFAIILRDAAEQLGARFEFSTAVASIDPTQPATLRITNADSPRRFDAIVLCAGVQSAALLGPLGIRLPLRPVYGYSVSAHIPESINAPRSGVTDEHYKVAITRLGQRVRVAGASEIGGRPGHIDDGAIRKLYKVLADWFPAAGRLSKGVQVWKGASPALPDGPPVLGSSGIPGLWLNLGHGASGWTLACGSARVLADQIGGRAPAIDIEGLGLERIMGHGK
ncbi:D-amino acid dehydrogenase [Ottowia thiooxydans]|uniref:D-amino acid dehydrogenase n=1 Tax=Ottowia thiooxydans TaxID=219182 RepID=UPI0003FC7750|nr:D-amino acid dehydrogenase [Ottowia thiooxydans]